jgi:SNF2 family DNA or RNA helicase
MAGTARKVAIVCPSSLVGQWAKEFNKWLSYRLKVTVVDGTLGEDS